MNIDYNKTMANIRAARNEDGEAEEDDRAYYSSGAGIRLNEQMEARWKLEDFARKVREESYPIKPSEIEDMVNIVKLFPCLAAVGSIDGIGDPPLHLVLRSGGKLHAVQAFEQYSEDQRLKQHVQLSSSKKDNEKASNKIFKIRGRIGTTSELPLHVACQYSDDDVIEYIATRYPEAIIAADADGMLPIHYALERSCRTYGRSPSIHTIKNLVVLCPLSVALHCSDSSSASSSNHSTNNKRRFALIDALRNYYVHNHGLEVIRCMIDHFSATKNLDIDLPLGMNLCLTIEIAKMLFKVELLKMDNIEYWTNEAFIHFMKQLQFVPPAFPTGGVRRLSLALPTHFLTTYSETRGALRMALQRNCSLEEICLDVCSSDKIPPTRWNDNALVVAAIRKGLQDNKILQKLELKNFVLPNANSLGRLLSSGSAPRVLSLDEVQITGPWTARTDQCWRDLSKCQVEELTVRWTLPTTRSEGSSFSKLVQSLANLPRLNKLYLVIEAPPFLDAKPQGLNLTRPLVKLVQNAKELRCLKIYGRCDLDNKQIFETLRTNRALQELKVSTIECDDLAELAELLEHYNTSLTTVWVRHPMSSEMAQHHCMAKLRYFENLNRCGRGEIRDPAITLTAFVEKLQAVKGKSGLSEEKALCILHGLLRECPGLWSVL